MSDRSKRYRFLLSTIKTLPEFCCSVYASATFEFIVEGKSFFVHEGLLSLHSKPLDRMANGFMAEATHGFIILTDVDADTFVRFIEWAYKGYYTPADFTRVVQEDSDSAGRCTEEQRVAGKPAQRIKFTNVDDSGQTSPNPAVSNFQITGERDGSGKKRKTAPSSPHTPGAGLMPLPPLPFKRKDAIKIPPPRPNESPAEVYSAVFLSHARLYVFAEEYDIQALKTLALVELSATLKCYTLHANRTADIVELLRYVYGNTSEQEEGVVDLRALMIAYLRREMTTLTQDKTFKDLMIEDGGALLGDVMTAVRTKISKADEDLQTSARLLRTLSSRYFRPPTAAFAGGSHCSV